MGRQPARCGRGRGRKVAGLCRAGGIIPLVEEQALLDVVGGEHGDVPGGERDALARARRRPHRAQRHHAHHRRRPPRQPRPKHPFPAAVAAVTLHGCYGVVLKQCLGKATCLIDKLPDFTFRNCTLCHTKGVRAFAKTTSSHLVLTPPRQVLHMWRSKHRWQRLTRPSQQIRSSIRIYGSK